MPVIKEEPINIGIISNSNANRSPLFLFAGIVLSIIAFTTATSTRAKAAQSSACLSTTGEAAVIACQRELNLAPDDLDIRFALCEALIDLRRHREAVDVLKEALERFPYNSRVKQKLSTAENLLEEQLWIEKRRQRQDASRGGPSGKKLDTATRLNKIRCTRLKGDTALKACHAALQVLPEDPSLHRGKADVLLDMNRVGEAVSSYRQALQLDPANAQTSNRLRAAESKRKGYVSSCQRSEGPTALEACNTALVKGAVDEFAIQARRGELLQGMKRTAEAKDAYQTALKLKPNNPEINKRLATLTRPVSIAKAKVPKRQTSTPKPRAPKPPETPNKPLPEEPLLETGPTSLVATVDREIEPAIKVAPSPRPMAPPPKRYSNRPAIAGITH